MARLCSDVTIQIFNGEDLVTAKDDEFANFFYNRWNGDAGSKQGLNALYTNLFLFGLAYDYTPVGSIGFLPSEQWVLPTQRTTPYISKSSFFQTPDYYEFSDNYETLKILPEELVIIKYYDPSDVDHSNDGISPLQPVWKTVEAENNRGEAESALFKNRGISGFVSGKNGGDGYGLIGKAAQAARDVFSKLTGGASKFNKVEVIEGSVEFTQLGMDAGDLKLVESRLNHVRDICNTFGVPSLLFNDKDSRTHANYNEAKKSMYTDFVLPQVELFIEQYTRGFIEKVNEKNGSEYSLKIDLSTVTVLNPTAEQVRTEALLQYEKGLLTRAETREAINRPIEMEKEELSPMEVLFRMSPLTANNFINSMSPEDRDVLIQQIGLKQD